MKREFKFQSSELPCCYLITGNAIHWHFGALGSGKLLFEMNHVICRIPLIFLLFPAVDSGLGKFSQWDCAGHHFHTHKKVTWSSQKEYIGIMITQVFLSSESPQVILIHWQISSKRFCYKLCMLIICVFQQRKNKGLYLVSDSTNNSFIGFWIHLLALLEMEQNEFLYNISRMIATELISGQLWQIVRKLVKEGGEG